MSGRHHLVDQDAPTELLWPGSLKPDDTQPLWPVVDLDEKRNERGRQLVRIFQALRKW